MRAREFIDEIRTMNELVPLTSDKKELIASITVEHYIDDIYYGYSGQTLVVASKVNGPNSDANEMNACAVCVLYNNPHYKLLPQFYVPKNMYSWVKDGGVTTTKLIKAIINLAQVPVLSDLEMTPPAKKTFQRKIENGEIGAKIFNICNGDITPYNSDIWVNDDDCRVIFFEHALGTPDIKYSESSKLLTEYSYNWSDIMKRPRWNKL